VPDERVLLKNGQPIALTPKAFDLLSFLAANPGRLLTKDEILQAVWPDAVVEESNLAYHVFAIRKALGDGVDTDRYIETVPKRGYRFIAPIAQPGPESSGVTDEKQTGAAPLSLQRFQEPLWGRPAEPMMFSISPDSRHLMAAIQGVDGVARLWVRTLSESAPRPLLGSEGFIMPPAIWSPGSDAVAFAHGGPLKRVSLFGGVPQHVCELPGIAVGGSWNREDVILAGSPTGPLLRCPASGGVATPVTQASDPLEMHLMPSFLSDGRHFIYLRIHRAAPERSGVYVGDLNDSSPAGEKRLLATGFNAIHVPQSDAGGGAIIFLRDRALLAQRFDETRLELRGVPVRLADTVGSYLDYAYFSASARILVYRTPDPLYQLTWFDREGREMRRVGAPEPVAGLALSPSGDRALVARHVPHNVADQDLWLFDLARDANPQRLTFAASLESWPTWLTDDRFAYGAGGGERSIYEGTIGGRHRLWFQAGGSSGVTAASNGRVAVFVGMTNPTTRGDLWVWTEKGPPEGVPLITREGDQAQAQLSPDGRWLAYVSNETGRNEVFIAPFRYDASTGEASVGDSVPASDGGGFAPRWRGDGRELFYLKPDGSVMTVDVRSTSGVAPASLTRLFSAAGVFPEWGITHDGSRLLFAVPIGPAPPLQIVQNWQSMLPD
jgi:eukaryotic-like serine/threonine-protein kinase